jgi:hypothetical protein
MRPVREAGCGIREPEAKQSKPSILVTLDHGVDLPSLTRVDSWPLDKSGARDPFRFSEHAQGKLKTREYLALPQGLP